MNQVWNIFRKDVRHHWPEIAASLALLVAFAWFEIRSWSQFGDAATGAAAVDVLFFFRSRMLPGLVSFLLPVSWIFLIVRGVQGESLVGDRQFWLTRPYDWKQLLVAKILFVLAFINLPFLGMTVFLLTRAGFPPAHYVVGLLWMQWSWILFLFLWTAALACVTKNISQMLLAVLFVVLYVIGTSAISSAIRHSNFSGSVDSLSGFIVIGTAVAVILIQYSRRKTALSRWLTVGVCALLAVASVASELAPPDTSRITREYPLSSGPPPVDLALAKSERHDGEFSPIYNGEVSVLFPLTVGGIPNDSFLNLDGMIVTLTKGNGFRWDTGWRGTGLQLFPDQKSAQIGFQIKQNIFDQLNSGPVTAHFLLAFTMYQNKNQRQFIVPSGEFRLPELGRCSSENQYRTGIQCLTPLRRPAFLLITSEIAASPCPRGDTGTPSPLGIFARASVQGGPEPAEMGISPLHEVPISLSSWEWSPGRVVTPGICPGTPLTLSNPEVEGRHRIELELDNLSLNDFRERLPVTRMLSSR
ncbi:MAG TPA: hypothetical protein VKB49_04455 [Candidatus Sulfotelmatobacter sp.]|nr:hypothetical protein [Candidatus Sulfotelmatobacter sp.]